MRVGLVIETFDPARGGAEHWTCQFASQLVSNGHEVHIAARKFAASGLSKAFHRHPVNVGQNRIQFAQVAYDTLKPFHLDIIHDMGAGIYGDIFQPHGGSRQATFEANVRMTSPWLRPVKRVLAKVLPRYREFDQLLQMQYEDRGQVIIALSKRVVQELQQYHGVSSDRIRLVYNGVDIDRFSPCFRDEFRGPVRQEYGVADNTLLLFIAAHNFRLKGVPALIRAVSQLGEQGLPVELLVAGGKRLAYWQQFAARHGVSKQVRFLGPVKNVMPLYAAADVYVQPTFYDPCSLVVLEALASGLPVITSTCNGASEIMTNGVHGYLLQDPADVTELAHLISQLADADQRQSMGIAARELAKSHSLRRNYQEIVSIYSEFVCRKGLAA